MLAATEWAFFNVALPLAPILLVRLAAWLMGLNKRFLIILRDGQLCFFASALAAMTVHDVHKATAGMADTSLAIVFLIGLIVLAMFVYGVAVILVDRTTVADDHKVAWTSIVTAVVTIFAVFGIRWRLDLLG